MSPLDFIVVLLHEVGLTLLTRTDCRVHKVEVTLKLVALDVLRYCRCLPRSEGVDTTTDCEVHMLTEGEVVAKVTDEETLGILTICWHQKTRLGACLHGEEAFGDTWEVDGHILHNEVCVARYHLLAGDDLRLCHGDVEVGVVGAVTCGVHTVADMYRLVGVHLHAATDEPAIALLCCDTLDLSLAGVEVVGDGIHRVWSATIRELGLCAAWCAILAEVCGVGVAMCEDVLRLHVHTHVVGLEVHALICHIATLVAVYELIACIEYYGVYRLTLYDIGEVHASAAASLGCCLADGFCGILNWGRHR